MMGSYAQTILQLQAQLRQAAYGENDQQYLASAYRLATELFGSQFRGSGKTFIAHLVGTASILVSNDAPVTLVAAGLLHAAYEAGDFGSGLWGRHHHRKHQLIQAVGGEAEKYIEDYFRLRWTAETMASLLDSVATAPGGVRRVLLIRLANELEDHLDLGIRFCGNSAHRVARMVAFGDQQVDLARRLGYTRLAAELSQAFADNQAAVIPETLQGQRAHSYLQIPRSCRRRYLTALRSFLSRR